MKIIKTCSYALSEKTLELDIGKFILAAEGGDYQMDHRYGQEGLKIIKAYFRMIQEEFSNGNYAVSRMCYKKLMFLLLQSKYNYFDYEDIVGKLNFKKLIENYFICLAKLCNIDELFKEYTEYLKVSDDYYFESADRTIITQLPEASLSQFASKIQKEAENIKEDDYAMHGLIYFLLSLAKYKKDKEAYYAICDKYKHIIDEEQKEEFDGD